MLINSPYVYSATKSEIELSERIARARCELKSLHNVKSKKYATSESEADIHTLGILGEFAVSVCLGIPLSMPITLRGDSGFDMTSDQIGRISVKTRSRANYDFALTPGESNANWDIGILVCPKGSMVKAPYEFIALRLVGWITRIDFHQRAIMRDYGHGSRLAVPNSRLRPMVDIKHPIGTDSVRSSIDRHGLDGAFLEITNG